MATATANRFSPAASKRGERRRGLHAARVEAVERLGATCALWLCWWCAWWHVVAFGMMIRCHEMMVIGCAMLVSWRPSMNLWLYYVYMAAWLERGVLRSSIYSVPPPLTVYSGLSLPSHVGSPPPAARMIRYSPDSD